MCELVPKIASPIYINSNLDIFLCPSELCFCRRMANRFFVSSMPAPWLIPCVCDETRRDRYASSQRWIFERERYRDLEAQESILPWVFFFCVFGCEKMQRVCLIRQIERTAPRNVLRHSGDISIFIFVPSWNVDEAFLSPKIG